MKSISLLLFLLSISAGAFAQKGWEKAGEALATARLENESILVTTPAKYQAIKLCAVDAPLRITGLEIYFTTGDPQVIEQVIDLEAGGESSPIGIKGSRVLKKVVFYYTILPNTKQNQVSVELSATR